LKEWSFFLGEEGGDSIKNINPEIKEVVLRSRVNLDPEKFQVKKAADNNLRIILQTD
jgi:hypothetical protein